MLPTSIKIIKTLKQKGFEAYWAGGCVRDFLLGLNPQDFDIATSAKPEELKKIFPHTIHVGEKFGVIKIIKNTHHFEIATFRSDSRYSDGRRPNSIRFTNAKEDAFRRDFTINGIFFDPIAKKIIDFVGGQNDLRSRVIRFIGNSEDRIKEDHLRILRAIRFRNMFEFQYEPKTYESLKKKKDLIKKVSSDRIRIELGKILLKSLNIFQAFEDLYETGIIDIILPELAKMKGVAQPVRFHKEGDVWTHTMVCLKSLPKGASLILRWAVLLHDIGKPDTFNVTDRIHFNGHTEVGEKTADKILRRLNFSNKNRKHILWLVAHHMMLFNLIDMTETRRTHWFRDPYFPDLIRIHRADILGSKPSDLTMYKKIKNMYLEWKKREQKKKRTEKKHTPILTGKDLIRKCGMQEGPQIGEMLSNLQHARLEEHIKTKKEAMEYVKKQLDK